MKKQANRLLSALLVLLMLFTLLPVASAAPSMSIVDASEEIDTWLKEQDQPEEEYDLDVEERTAATDDGTFYRILHLDCGRKYFSPEWVKALINEMSAAGYTHLQLAFGNDGLRFLLDDMNLDINGDGEYEFTTADVISGVESGNEAANKSGDSSWWSEADMDGIIAHAKTMGIEIIPLLNLPGHANAILDIPADDMYNYTYGYYYTSQNTLNIFNSEAKEFGLAILKKYVDYFAAKGCEFFNFGADEFANDLDSDTIGAFSFSLLKSDEYTEFVDFINEMATYIKSKDMTPRAFNDGLYYNYSGNGQKANVDTAIQCCYWSSGWGSYPVAKSYQISGKGHDMINTHGDFYYVLGKADEFDKQGDDYALNFNNSVYPGDSSGQTTNTIGSMFCIWSDYPNAETETEIASNVRMILRMMAARMQDTYKYDGEDVIVPGGFNANGSINENDPVVPVKPEEFPDSAGVASSIKVGETANYTLGASAEWTSSNEDVLSLTEADIANAAVTASSVKATAHKAGTTTVTATLTDGTVYEAQVTVTSDSTDPTEPDFSELREEYKGTVTETTGTGATYYELINGASAIVSGEKYLVLNSSSDRPYMLTTDAGAQQLTTAIANNRVTDAVDESCEWTLTGNTADGFTMKSSSGYLYPNGTWYGYWTYSLKSDADSGENVTIADTSSPAVNMSRNVSRGSDLTTAYVYVSRSWGNYVYSASDSPSNLYLFHKVVEPADTVWMISTEGLQKLYDEVENLDSSLYTSDSWSAFKTALNNAESTLTEYSNAASYDTERLAVAAQTIINTSALNLYNARQALVQDTTLTIEYWITNARLKGTESQLQYCTVSSTMDDITSEQGVATVDLVDALGTKNGRTQEYWQTKLLDVEKTNNSTSGTELQSEKAGDDETLAGETFTSVRYWDGKWQVYTNEWIDVDLTTTTAPKADDKGNTYKGPRHQLVAYYMEVLDIANSDGKSELHANIADWGARGDGGTFGYNYNGATCTVSIQVVYEDSSTNPANESSANQMQTKTYVYGYWSQGRGLGTLRLSGGEDYQIFKVTAETGTSTCTRGSSTSGTTFTVNSLKWDDNEVEVWSGALTDSVAIGNPTSNPSYTSPYDHLAWNTSNYCKNNAILIRVYVKSIPKEDSLTVHYIDQSVQPQIEFYNLSIAVKNGTTFDPNFKFNEGYADIDNALSNHTVENYYGQTQTVQANLGKLTEIGAGYRNGTYELVNAVRDSNGKDVYLYYTFNNTHFFVVDFGEELTFTKEDLGIKDGTWAKAEITQGQYGTASIAVGQPAVYTPTKVMQGADLLIVTLTDENATSTNTSNQQAAKNYVKHHVYIVPASNVLYEETFFNEKTTGEYTPWTQNVGTTGTQSADQNTLYGYDDIYAKGTGNSMDSSYYANLEAGGSTNDLTTTFTGTAFDLIGTCGSDTGYVYLKIVDSEKHGRAAVIDTSYSGDYGTLHQVPLAHLVMGDTNKDYTVTVFGAYRKAANATNNAASVMRARSYAADGLDAIYDRLADDGFAPDEVEYIYFDASSELAQMDNATFASLDMADAMTDGTVAPMASNQAGSVIEIDGFRVYSTTTSQYYSDSEQGMTYARMLDMVNDNFMAYVENDETRTWSLSDYEANGGPQNEIYLDKNDAVLLNISGMTSLQITARVAGGKDNAGSLTLWVDEIQVPIETSTEMYYNIDLTKVERTVLTIRTDSDNVLLGLANVKYRGTLNTLSQEDIDEALALLNNAPVEPEPVEPEPTVFTPERFDADIHVTRAIFRKYVTISVKTSLDVAYITVNGQRVDTPSTTNRWFSWGANGTRNFTFRDTIGRNDNVAYEVIAYDADGNASEPIILH